MVRCAVQRVLQSLLRSSGMLVILGVVVTVLVAGGAWSFVVLYLIPIGLLVLIGYVRWRKEHAAWRARGMCRQCGYPRKRLPPAALCPECGEAPANAGPR